MPKKEAEYTERFEIRIDKELNERLDKYCGKTMKKGAVIREAIKDYLDRKK